MAVRAFVALELSPQLKAGILRAAETLERRGVRASWSRRATLHLTLKFIGDVDEADLPDVVDAVGRAASGNRRFSFVARGAGAFPSPQRPRVIWIGVVPSDALFDLQGDVERELAAVGVPREERRWSPHITVGRVRDARTAGDLAGALATLRCPEDTVAVEEVLLMRSVLSPSGAIHEAIARFPLATAGPDGRAEHNG
ncbi:MAG: RNA 2',3'-cyclic phosphodiesterase [Candidatus Eisenbacteria bacterium]|nr:RNA 2',3'-cyclic phosphodiesterase [Candidatus Eisenbacteria bacterium]